MADIFETKKNIDPGSNLDHFLADFDRRFVEYATKLREERSDATHVTHASRAKGVAPVVGAGVLASRPYDREVEGSPEVVSIGPVA